MTTAQRPATASDPIQLAQQAAAFLGLTIDPAHLDGVAANLVLLAQHVERIMTSPLPPDAEPAPVFHP